jgi:hypothetical protein
MFKVNQNELDAVKILNSTCKVDAGIVIYKNGVQYDEEVFFGEGATYELQDDILFVSSIYSGR